MKLNRFLILFMLMIFTILSGCNQPDNQKHDTSQPNKKSTTYSDLKESTQNIGAYGETTEAEYFPTDNPKYKTIGNGRLNFWIDIPIEWKAFDRSANGDGYFIVPDNEDIDIRTYGGLNAISADDYINALKGDKGKVSDFVFRNNAIGKEIAKPDSEINFTCFLPDRHIDFFINYEKDRNWFDKNKNIIQYIAKSLRTGDEKKSETEAITDIKNWNHSAKKAFQDDNIDLVKVELLNNKTYPIFYIKLPYEISLGNEDSINYLLDAVALSNGYWNYEIKDEAQSLDIKVQCDQKNKKISEISINGDDSYFKNLFNKQNENLIKAITSMKENQLEILAKDDIDNDGFSEAVVKYESRLFLVRDRNTQRDFIGELKDYIHVVHEIESVEMAQLDKTNKKYIVTHSYQGMNGGSGFTIYSLENNEISLINNNFYGATAKGQSSLEDIDKNGILDSVLRIKHYDLQQHILVIYTNWNGSGDTHYKIEYGNDISQFVYPSKPEDVIRNYIEDYYWKEHLTEEMGLLTAGGIIEIADFESSFGTPSTLEYRQLYIDYKTVSGGSTKKVISGTIETEGKAVYYFTMESKNDKWIITAISKNKPND